MTLVPRSLASLLLLTWTLTSQAAVNIEVSSHWDGGFNGKFCIHITQELTSWRAHLVFDQKIESLEVWKADVVETKAGGREFVLANKPWNGAEHVGDDLCIDFLGHSEGDITPIGTVFVEGMSDPGTAPTLPQGSMPPSTAPPPHHALSGPARYNYSEVLAKSILFFAAQRSGKLPPDNPIPWRGDSALGDKGDNGEDLTGGWYDAGDHVKFNFPMASSTTILLWGLIKWADAYKAAGQLDAAYDCVKWPLDYFLKCWIPSKETYYVQVGDGQKDHSYWGRAEDMTMPRPALKVTPQKPGSDVAGETAAALAAGSIAFQSRDSAYAQRLLTASKSLYEFAKKYQAKYTDSLPEITYYYASGHFEDELCEAAIWLYKATNDTAYLEDAKKFVTTAWAWALSWDDKSVACQLLLYEATGNKDYRQEVEGYMIGWTPSRGMTYTPCGLAYRSMWGALRYSADTALLALMAAEAGIHTEQYQKWALTQMNYILGDNKMHISYVIGYGNKYPRSPHHRSCSCPDRPAVCDWNAFNNTGPSPQVLVGALVGGPDESDNYIDDRKDYVHNEVACDYNAGLQSALAGLIHLEETKQLPPADPPKC